MNNYLKFTERILEKNMPLVGLFLGGIVFILLYGTKILDTSYIDWTMRNDLCQHFLGWHFFRSEPWSFPLGVIKSYNYPDGTSLIYTDSIPLLALPLKLLSPYLPHIFQYQGLWILISYLLQGFFATLLMQQISRNMICIFLGVLFFLLSPIIAYRLSHAGGHEALTSHWVILASIYLYFQPRRMKSQLMWLLLLVVTVWIHFYLAFMSFCIFLGWLLKSILENYKDNIVPVIISLSSVLISVFAAMWIAGYFIIDFSSAGRAGFGNFSMNLLSVINPHNDDISIFIKPIPVLFWQYEGFNYFGLGVILLLVLSVYQLLRNKIVFNLRMLLPLILVAVILVLISLSNMIYIGNKLLFSISLPYQVKSVLSLFRSSGRFFWPVYYLLILSALTVLIRYSSTKRAILILTLLLSIQVIDMSKYYSSIKEKVGSEPALEQPLKSTLWNRIMEKTNHIVIVPSKWDNRIPYTFGLLAANHRSTLNVAYLARAEDRFRSKYNDEIHKELEKGQIRKDTLYVMMKKDSTYNDLRERMIIKSRANSETSDYIWGLLDGYFIIAPFLELSQADLLELKPFK